MSKKHNDKAKVLRGILSPISGSLENLVVTKRGIIYFRNRFVNKKKNT